MTNKETTKEEQSLLKAKKQYEEEIRNLLINNEELEMSTSGRYTVIYDDNSFIKTESFKVFYDLIKSLGKKSFESESIKSLKKYTKLAESIDLIKNAVTDFKKTAGDVEKRIEFNNKRIEDYNDKIFDINSKLKCVQQKLC